MGITDGFDGDLTALQAASGAVAAEGITTLGVAYDETPGILVSTLEDIANGNTNNVYTAGSNEALAALSTDVFDAICSNARMMPTSTEPLPQIINRFIYE